jgi:hypothetical protein
VIQHWKEMWISLGIFAVTSVILKFTWYDWLGPGEMYMTADGHSGSLAPVPVKAAAATAANS